MKSFKAIKVAYHSRFFSIHDFIKLGSSEVILFADNERDKYRKHSIPRLIFGGQSSVAGKYDRDFEIVNNKQYRILPKAYGISSFYNLKNRNIIERYKLIDKEFDILEKNYIDKIHIFGSQSGYLKHPLGGGIASLSQKERYYIQAKLDNISR
jgi:hypothetical protein